MDRANNSDKSTLCNGTTIFNGRVNNDANGNVEDGNETEGEVLVNGGTAGTGERLASSSSSSGNGLGARPKVRPSTSQQPHHQPGTVQLPSQESFQSSSSSGSLSASAGGATSASSVAPASANAFSTRIEISSSQNTNGRLQPDSSNEIPEVCGDTDVDENDEDFEEEDDLEEEEEEEELTADLPKSFFFNDGCCECSDGEGRDSTNILVSSPGQSNLSQEVAEALRHQQGNCRHATEQASTSRQRRNRARRSRHRPRVRNGGSPSDEVEAISDNDPAMPGGEESLGAAAAAAVPAAVAASAAVAAARVPPIAVARGESPESFLEMDFGPGSGDDSDDSGDSGRGADETTDGGQEDMPEAAAGARGGGGGGYEPAPGGPDPAEPSSASPAAPSDRELDINARVSPPRGEDSSSLQPEQLLQLRLESPSSSLQEPSHAAGGVTSAPLQSPADALAVVDQLMVRSRSLNSPMMNCAAAASSSGPSRGPRRHNSGGDSKLGQAPSPRRLRGDLGAVSMEQCSARLSMRQALFGLSPSTSQASGGSQTNNPNQGPSEPTMGSLASNTSSFTRDKNSSSQITPTSSSKDSRIQRTQKAMIWSETEAFKRQAKFGTHDYSMYDYDQCFDGAATAFANVLNALDANPRRIGFQDETEEDDCDVTTEEDDWPPVLQPRYQNLTRDTPVATYLFARSVAGYPPEDIIKAVSAVTSEAIIGRFFHMWPRRSVRLESWLSSWIRRGGVPVLTMRDPGHNDNGWRHQMAFGAGPAGVYVTNPVECVPASELAEQLSAPSELLVRAADVALRWREDENDLHLLLEHPDERWDVLNVLGQVVNVIRNKDRTGPNNNAERRSQWPVIRIPTPLRSGVTIFVRASDQAARRELETSPDLPLWEPPPQATAASASGSSKYVSMSSSEYDPTICYEPCCKGKTLENQGKRSGS